MTCPRCLADPHPKDFGQPRKCAFYERGGFKADNWRCATLDALRYCLLWRCRGDASIGVALVPETEDSPEGFLVMTWHKDRGAVANAVIAGDYPGTRDFRLEIAELILSEAKKRANDEDDVGDELTDEGCFPHG